MNSVEFLINRKYGVERGSEREKERRVCVGLCAEKSKRKRKISAGLDLVHILRFFFFYLPAMFLSINSNWEFFLIIFNFQQNKRFPKKMRKKQMSECKKSERKKEKKKRVFGFG